MEAVTEAPPSRGVDTEGLTGVRRMIFTRARERRCTLADLSRAAGKNHSYMHQFLYRQTPAMLPEDVRHAVAEMLDLPEAQLRQNRQRPGDAANTAPLVTEASSRPAARRANPPPSFLSTPSGSEGVPVFLDTDQIALAQASEWSKWPGPATGQAAGTFGVYVSRSRGRFRPGDLIFIRPRMPPREGDSVVALLAESIEAIGDLTDLGSDSATIQDGPGEPKTVRLDGVSLLKVAVAQFA